MIRSRVFFQSMCGCVQCLSDRYEIVWRIYSQMRGWQTFRNVRRGSCGQRIISISGRLPLRITKTLHVRRVYTRASDDRAIANSFFIFFFFTSDDRRWLLHYVRARDLFLRVGSMKHNIYDELWNSCTYLLGAFFTFFFCTICVNQTRHFRCC